MRDVTLHSALGGAVLALMMPAMALRAQGDAKPDAKPDDYDKRVVDACGSNPLIRMQAAKRVAKGGAAAAAAVLRYAEAKGASELSSELVMLLGGIEDAKLRAALETWVADADFAWRPQALLALAQKAQPTERDLFEAFLKHGSWQMRRAAVVGIANLHQDDGPRLLGKMTSDGDARVSVLAATLLLAWSGAGSADTKADAKADTLPKKPEHGEVALPVLVRGLDAEDAFFGDDFGRLARKEAFDALRKFCGQDFGYRVDAPAAERRAPLQRFQKLCEQVLDTAIEVPQSEALRAFSLGYERRSCRDGDLVLRLDAQGRLWKGAFQLEQIDIDEATRDELRRLSRGVEAPRKTSFGRIRCDLTRFAGLGAAGNISLRAAPESEPEAVQALGKRLVEIATR